MHCNREADAHAAEMRAAHDDNATARATTIAEAERAIVSATAQHARRLESALAAAQVTFSEQTAMIEAVVRRELLDIHARAAALAVTVASGESEMLAFADAAVRAARDEGSVAVGEARAEVLDLATRCAAELAELRASTVSVSVLADLRTSLEASVASATLEAACHAATAARADALANANSLIAAADDRATAAEARVVDLVHWAEDNAVAIQEHNLAGAERDAYARMGNLVDEAVCLSSAAWEQRLSAERLESASAAADLAKSHTAAIAEASITTAQLELQLCAALATTDAVAQAASAQISALEVSVRMDCEDATRRLATIDAQSFVVLRNVLLHTVTGHQCRRASHCSQFTQ